MLCICSASPERPVSLPTPRYLPAFASHRPARCRLRLAAGETFMATENSHTRGAVKDPEHDGRLKENRDDNTSKGTAHASSHESSGHTRGAVKDPEHDSRLKEN